MGSVDKSSVHDVNTREKVEDINGWAAFIKGVAIAAGVGILGYVLFDHLLWILDTIRQTTVVIYRG
jgi:hypothetical protein